MVWFLVNLAFSLVDFYLKLQKRCFSGHNFKQHTRVSCFYCSGSSADNILCPLPQYTRPKCVGQQEVHGQEPAGHGSGFRSEPNGANNKEQSEWLPWFRAHDLLNSSFSAILYVDFITSLEVNIFLHCNYLMTYVTNYSADKSLCQS